MTTKNKAVKIYLPLELEEKISQYCFDKNIVREDKNGKITPSLGIAILKYLNHEFLNEELIGNNQENSELQEKVNSIEKKLEKLENEIIKLRVNSIIKKGEGQGLSNIELAERLKINVKILNNKKYKTKENPEKFREWSRGLDPESIGWEYRSEKDGSVKGRYYNVEV